MKKMLCLFLTICIVMGVVPMISLATTETGTNLSLTATATQSSSAWGSTAGDKAVDGDWSTFWNANTEETPSWVCINLPQVSKVSSINIWEYYTATDGYFDNIQYSLDSTNGIDGTWYNLPYTKGTTVSYAANEYQYTNPNGQSATWANAGRKRVYNCPTPVMAKYIKITAATAAKIYITEIEIFGKAFDTQDKYNLLLLENTQESQLTAPGTVGTENLLNTNLASTMTVAGPTQTFVSVDFGKIVSDISIANMILSGVSSEQLGDGKLLLYYSHEENVTYPFEVARDDSTLWPGTGGEVPACWTPITYHADKTPLYITGAATQVSFSFEPVNARHFMLYYNQAAEPVVHQFGVYKSTPVVTWVLQIANGQPVVGRVEMKNTTPSFQLNFEHTYILAVYDNNGSIYDIRILSKSDAIAGVEETVLLAELASKSLPEEDAENYSAKLFVWENIGNMRPIITVEKLPVE